MLGEAAAEGRGVALADVLQPARHGLNGPRPEGEIGFSVLRGGGIIGEHSVTFASEEEILTFSHSARDRGLFARGALAARSASHEKLCTVRSIPGLIRPEAAKSTCPMACLAPFTRKCPALSAVPAMRSPGTLASTVASTRRAGGRRNGAASALPGTPRR
jgi:hypothetical protein